MMALKNIFIKKSECVQKHADISKCLDEIAKKQDEMLILLRGDPKSRVDSGLVGEVEDLKGNVMFDRKILYGIITLMVGVGITVLLSLLKGGP
jgi:hypothetical protein